MTDIRQIPLPKLIVAEENCRVYIERLKQNNAPPHAIRRQEMRLDFIQRYILKKQPKQEQLPTQPLNQRKEPMTNSMNYSTAIFLDEKSEVRAIAVTYEEIHTDQDTTKMMPYTAPYLSTDKLPAGAIVKKTLDQSIKVGDFVVVPTNTRHQMTVCKVVAVDVEVDLDSSAECHWVIAKIDTAKFETVRQQEAAFIAALRRGAVAKKRKRASKAFMKGIKGNLPSITGTVETVDDDKPVEVDLEKGVDLGAAVDPDDEPSFADEILDSDNEE